MLHEARVYKKIQGGVGIPKIYWVGVQGDFNVLVMELLGPTLENLKKKCEKKLSLKTVLMIADQLVLFLSFFSK